MKRIVFFINCMASGGAEHQLAILANMLSEKGYDVTITTYGDTPDHYDLNIKIKRVKLAEGRNKGIKFLAIFKYFYILKSDWVVTFDQRNNFFAMIPFFFRRKKGLRILCGERNFTVDGRQSIYEKVLTKLLYRRADSVITNSFSQKKHLLKEVPCLSNKLGTIINHTELNHYIATPLPHNNPLKIVTFSRYTKQKNCLRFADAIKIVIEKCAIPFEIHWYGNFFIHGNELNSDFEEFKMKVELNGLSQIIRLHDATKDVAAVMSQMDAFTLPSLYEGFSNSLAEAICCGKPILASDVSDNSVMLHNNVNGFLFNPLDVDDMANAFIQYLNMNQSERDIMGKNSRLIAEQLFSGNQFIDSYLAVLER